MLVSWIIYGIEHMGKTQPAYKQLSLYNRSPLGNLVVAHICARRHSGIHLAAYSHSLLRPVIKIATDGHNLSLLGQPVKLLLPLGIAPLVGRLHEILVPYAMEIGITPEITELHAIATAVSGMPHVHRLMKVTHQMDHHFQGKPTLILALGRIR